MALKACSECKKEISSDVTVCPNCGKKMPHGISKAGVVIAVIVMLGVGQCVCMAAKNASDPATSKAIAMAAINANKPKPSSGPIVSVDAVTLWTDYDKNEVAADDKYKGKRLNVSGKISSIDKDAFDNIVIHLRTPNQFEHVSATLSDKEKSKAAAAQKGQAVTFLCVGGTRIVGTPMLDDCVFQ